jgi:hypothetical protein
MSFLPVPNSGKYSSRQLPIPDMLQNGQDMDILWHRSSAVHDAVVEDYISLDRAFVAGFPSLSSTYRTSILTGAKRYSTIRAVSPFSCVSLYCLPYLLLRQSALEVLTHAGVT